MFTGLINFRDQKENFYGLICAYKGEVKPSSGGDLNSLCDDVSLLKITKIFSI